MVTLAAEIASMINTYPDPADAAAIGTSWAGCLEKYIGGLDRETGTPGSNEGIKWDGSKWAFSPYGGGASSGANFWILHSAANTSTAERWLGMLGDGTNGTKPVVTDQTYYLVLPEGGEVKEITVFATNDPGSTTMSVYVASSFAFGAATYTDTQTFSAAGSDFKAVFTFSSATFTKGQVLAVSINPTAQPGDMVATTALVFT